MITILVVEDNKINRITTKAILEKLGYDVFIAKNGENAIQLFEMKKPDAILMDIEMPGLDGIATLKKLQKRHEKDLAKVPVIAVTAHSSKEDRQKYFDAGVDDYLSKPFKPFELSTKLKKFNL